VTDYLNVTTWVNNYGWPIKSSHYFLLGLVEITLSLTNICIVQTHFYTIPRDGHQFSYIFLSMDDHHFGLKKRTKIPKRKKHCKVAYKYDVG